MGLGLGGFPEFRNSLKVHSFSFESGGREKKKCSGDLGNDIVFFFFNRINFPDSVSEITYKSLNICRYMPVPSILQF